MQSRTRSPHAAAFSPSAALPVPNRVIRAPSLCARVTPRAVARQQPSHAQNGARIAAAAAAASAVVALSLAFPAFATISAEQCRSGEGPGCEAAGEESPFIRELLEKSRANRAKNDQAALEKYWERGYGDYFSFGSNKDLVKGEDGKWSLRDPDDLRSRVERRIAEAIRGALK